MVGCPICEKTGLVNGTPCKHCEDGAFKLTECPREFMGSEFTRAVNFACMSGKGDWPVAGGLLDQAAWFIALNQELQNEQNRIDSERMNNG
jgi:hypothetical protein